MTHDMTSEELAMLKEVGLKGAAAKSLAKVADTLTKGNE